MPCGPDIVVGSRWRLKRPGPGGAEVISCRVHLSVACLLPLPGRVPWGGCVIDWMPCLPRVGRGLASFWAGGSGKGAPLPAPVVVGAGRGGLPDG